MNGAVEARDNLWTTTKLLTFVAAFISTVAIKRRMMIDDL